MTTFPSDNSNRTNEALSNALVQRTVFVTGAVGYKNVKGALSKNQGRVARDVMENLQQTMKENGAGNALH